MKQLFSDHQGQSFCIIGHRGAAGLAPENTLESFSKALDLGCRMVELDVHLSTDKHDVEHLLVIHDRKLNRTTNGRGLVSDFSTEALRLLDAGNGQQLPLLDEVFSLLVTHQHQHNETVALNIELKGANTAFAVASFIERQVKWPMLVSCFDHEQLRTFRSRDTQTAVAPLFDRWSAQWQATAVELKAAAVNLSAKIATPERVASICAAGYRVYVYTVNEPDAAQKFKDMGVAGVFTDRPDRLQHLAA